MPDESGYAAHASGRSYAAKYQPCQDFGSNLTARLRIEMAMAHAWAAAEQRAAARALFASGGRHLSWNLEGHAARPCLMVRHDESEGGHDESEGQQLLQGNTPHAGAAEGEFRVQSPTQAGAHARR